MTSSLNVELVYVVLKSISSFSSTDSLGAEAPHQQGLVVTTEVRQEPIKEIDMKADQVNFEMQATAECQKKRTQVL